MRIRNTVTLTAALTLAACSSHATLRATSTAPTSQQQRQAAAFSACKTAVTDRLISPATAKFPDWTASTVRKTGDVGLTVTSYVDSQNSYGALVRSDWQCTAALGNDGRVLNTTVVSITPHA